jgi:hypothetical protein
LPAGTFFDLAVVHVLTTATVERLRTLYPEGRFEVRRLRPRIVVSTGLDQQGFVEKDSIGQTITIGEEVRCGLPALSSLRDDDAATGRFTKGSGHPAYRRATQPGEHRRLRGRGRGRHHSARRFSHARVIGRT